MMMIEKSGSASFLSGARYTIPILIPSEAATLLKLLTPYFGKDPSYPYIVYVPLLPQEIILQNAKVTDIQ